MVDNVAYEVQTEPSLQPLTGETLSPGSNIEDEARLDIAARGFWQRGEMAFFDVRVFNPFAKSHLNLKLETVFKSNESQKKREYNDRVIKIEHGSFTPIVASACIRGIWKRDREIHIYTYNKNCRKTKDTIVCSC